MHRWIFCVISISSLLTAACGGGGDEKHLFPEKPECEGASIEPLSGQHPMVISFLEIGAEEDGFDLDGDGEPDNKLASVGDLARSAIEDSFENFEIIIPFEFFDFQDPAADECVKFAIYLGQFRQDRDGDGNQTGGDDADCNDHDAAIHKGATEIAGNYVDDDCDGLADETETVENTDAGQMTNETPSDNTEDMDGDGVTIADGDCDDTNDQVAAGMAEVCGDGFDNDCDGNADWAVDSEGTPLCSPYDESLEPIALDPLGFNEDGTPVVAFNSGTVTEEGGALELRAGPSIFSVNIPVTDDLNLDLQVSGATIIAEVVMTPGGYALMNGRLGGVLDAHTADDVRGLDVPEINLTEENSLLDATFANILGTILALPRLPEDHEFGGCHTPDIDVDGDGLEAFCDSDPLDDDNVVDVCIDGDGTVVRDEVDSEGNLVEDCTDATDEDGELRFVDGISVEFNFDTVPAMLPESLPEL